MSAWWWVGPTARREGRIARRLLGALVLGSVGASGCAVAGTGTAEGAPAEESVGDVRARETVTLTIDNQNFKDATIYARWNGQITRVGTVIGKTTGMFTLEWWGPSLTLEVDFLAGDRFRSRPIDVSRGDDLKFILRID